MLHLPVTTLYTQLLQIAISSLASRADRPRVVEHEWDPDDPEDPVIVVLPDGGVTLAFTDPGSAQPDAAPKKPAPPQNTAAPQWLADSLWARILQRRGGRDTVATSSAAAREAAAPQALASGLTTATGGARASTSGSRHQAQSSGRSDTDQFSTPRAQVELELADQDHAQLSDELSRASRAALQTGQPRRDELAIEPGARAHSVLGNRRARRQRWRAARRHGGVVRLGGRRAAREADEEEQRESSQRSGMQLPPCVERFIAVALHVWREARRNAILI